MGNLTIKLYDKWGRLKDRRQVVNTKTYTFSNLLARFLAGVGGNVFADRIAYGSSGIMTRPFDTYLYGLVSDSIIPIESFSSHLGGYLPSSGLFQADNGGFAHIDDGTESQLSSEDDVYNNWILIIKAGTNANNWTRVSDYIGSTKTFWFIDDMLLACDDTTQYKIFDSGTWHIHAEWAAGVGTYNGISEFGYWLNGYADNYLLARAVLDSSINKTVDDRLIVDWHGRIW